MGYENPSIRIGQNLIAEENDRPLARMEKIEENKIYDEKLTEEEKWGGVESSGEQGAVGKRVGKLGAEAKDEWLKLTVPRVRKVVPGK